MSTNRVVLHELTRLETELWNAVDGRLRTELDLPLGRYEAMRLIDEIADCRVLDIAEQLAITMGGASKLVERVAAAGLCDRRANPADGRSAIFTLTADGRRMLARAIEVVDAELETRIGPTLAGASLDGFLQTLIALRATGHALGRIERRRS